MVRSLIGRGIRAFTGSVGMSVLSSTHVEAV